MKARIARIFCCLILFLWSAPYLLGVYFLVDRFMIRERMHDKLERMQLQTISLPEKTVNWIGDDEILVAGQMFDVKTSKALGECIVFTGLFDNEETELLARQMEAAEEQEKNKTLSQVFQAISMFTIDQEQPCLPYRMKCCHPFPAATDLADMPDIILTPPPDRMS